MPLSHIPENPAGASNAARRGWRTDVPLCDAHTHLFGGLPFAWNLQSVRGYMRWFGIERLVVVALPEGGPPRPRDDGANLRCLGVKAVLNAEDPAHPVYALAGLEPHFDGTDSAADFADQARRALDMGYDGFKSLLGKPGARKWDGRALDDPIFDPFYSVLEERGRPLVFHVGDPPDFWDAAHAPAIAKLNGWLYDETFPPLAQIRAEAENILRKHPALHATFAHMYFLGEDPDEAERLFERYPNLSFDLTPGWEMYAGFTRLNDRWRPFFERYRDRIFFGTDTANGHASADLSTYEKGCGWAPNLVRSALERTEPFLCNCFGEDRPFTPLSVSDETLRAIDGGNFVRTFGAAPAPIDRAAAFESAKRTLARCEADDTGLAGPKTRAATRDILRSWTASPDALFAPEPFDAAALARSGAALPKLAPES